MSKTNKKYIAWLVIVIVLIIGVSIIYTNLNPKTDTEDSDLVGELDARKPKGTSTLVSKPINNPTYLRESSPQASLSIPADSVDSNSLDSIIESLDKTRCSELNIEIQKTFCIAGIDLIKKAIAANDINLCFDSSYRVETISRIICQQKISGLRK